MSANRICPVCGTRILSLNTTHCIKCNFDLENVNNVEAIEKTKKSLDDERERVAASLPKFWSRIICYIAGIIGAIIALLTWFFIVWDFYPSDGLCYFPFILPFGLLAGFITSIWEMKQNEYFLPSTGLRFLLYIIFSAIFSIVSLYFILGFLFDSF